MRPSHLIASLLLATAVAAPLAAAPITVPPLQYTERTLPNGLRLFAMPDKSATSVSIQVWYNVGGRDDPKGRSGFAHLFEHLMFKSTRNMLPEQMFKMVEDVGGDLNASTDDDFTEYHESAPANHLERLIWAEAERMGSLVIDQATFATERDVVKEELRRDAAQPYDSLFRLELPMASYGTASYARSPIGTVADLDAATVEDVRAFHALYYRPDNAVMVVAGNFETADLDRYVAKYLAPIAKPAWAISRTAAPEPERMAAKRYTLHAPNVPLPAVMMSWQLPPGTDPDRAAINMLDAILSGGESSRIYQSLVYRDRIATDAGISADIRKGTGMFTAYALLTAGKTPEEAEAALRREIAKVRDTPVTQEELTRVKNQIVTNTLKQRETAEGRASTLAGNVIQENDPNASDKRLAAIQSITPADIQRVAKRLLADDRTVTITYLPGKPGVAPESIGVGAGVVTAALVAPPNVPVVQAASAADRVQPPKPGAAVTPVLPTPVERRLANGMRLVVIERHALPIVTGFLVATGGSSTDPVNRAGLAEMTASVLTKGTATRSAPEIARTIEGLGGAIGGDATRDGMFLSLTVKSDQLQPAMDVFADVALHPAFAQEELERQRAQAIDGLSVAYTTPGQIASMAVSRVIYGDGPYGKPADGTPNSLKSITRDDMIAAYKARMRPDAVTLVMAGDISPDEAETVANRHFGGWAKPATPPPAPPAPGPVMPPRVVAIDLPQTPQAAVMLGRVTIARKDPLYYPMVVADSVLGGGFGARLNQEVRVARGLAYGAGSAFQARRSPGPFSASTSTKNTTVADVVVLMKEEMTKLGADLVPASELDARKAGLIGGFGRQVETTDGLAGYTAGLVLQEVPLDEIQRYAPAITAVTPAQVRDVAKTLIDPAPASVVIVGDAATFLPGLKTKGITPEVIPAAKLNLDSTTLQ
jgi:zinc protease